MQDNMTRASRVSIELFLPPLLGALPFLLIALVTWTPGMVPIVLLVAYVLAILPSMIFTVVLEFAFWRGLEPRSSAAVVLAAGLGLLSGLAIGLLGGLRGAADKAFAFGLIGLLVGTSTALLVRWRSAAAAGIPPER
jgi:hypothetical protein